MNIKSLFLRAVFILLSSLVICYLAVKVYHTYKEKRQVNVIRINKQSIAGNSQSNLVNFGEIEPFAKDIFIYQPFEGTKIPNYHINSEGLNNFDEFTIEKLPDVFRIMTLEPISKLALL